MNAVTSVLVCFSLLQGKSLSLICGSLTWLRDFEKRQKVELSSLLNSKLYALLLQLLYICFWDFVKYVIKKLFFCCGQQFVTEFSHNFSYSGKVFDTFCKFYSFLRILPFSDEKQRLENSA